MSAIDAAEPSAARPLGNALRLLGVGFAASALLVVLQTLVFQLLPWDAPRAVANVSLALRVAFLLADAITLASLVMLARLQPTLRGLFAVGAALATFAVLSDVLGLVTRTLGTDAPALRFLTASAHAMSGADALMSTGTTLLAALALGALARSHGSRAGVVTLLVGLSVALTVGFRLVRLVDAATGSLALVWVSWLVGVARAALVGWLALALARSGRRATPERRTEGPYRVAGAAPSSSPKEPFDAATQESLRRTAAGLAFYRTAFVARFAIGVGLALFALLVAFMKHAESALVLALVAIPLGGVGTAVALVIGLVKMRPRVVRARAAGVGAIVAIGLAGLIDGVTLLSTLEQLVASSRYGFQRHVTEVVVMAMPLTAFASGVSILGAAGIVLRLGERLADDRVVGRARWVQALAIGAGAVQLGALLAVLSRSTAWNEASTLGGMLVAAGLVLTGMGATLGVLILHVLLVSAARRSVLEAAPGPSHAG